MSNIQDYVHMDAILYLSPNYSIEERDQLIQKIIYLDTHPDAYQSMYEKIFFKNASRNGSNAEVSASYSEGRHRSPEEYGQIPQEFNLEKIKEKISSFL